MKKLIVFLLAAALLLSACAVSGTMTGKEAEGFIESLEKEATERVKDIVGDLTDAPAPETEPIPQTEPVTDAPETEPAAETPETELITEAPETEPLPATEPATEIPETEPAAEPEAESHILPGTAGQDEPEIPETFYAIELEPNTVVEREEYTLDGMYTDILSDRSVADGWYYYYSKGTESPTDALAWEHAAGTHTTCEVYVGYTNLLEKPDRTVKDRFSGFIVYRSPEDFTVQTTDINELRSQLEAYPEAELFDLTVMQANPDQVDTDGYPARSVDMVLLEQGQTALISVFADVSETFYRAWEDPENTEQMWYFFSLDDGVIYAVNLRTWLVDDNGEEPVEDN